MAKATTQREIHMLLRSFKYMCTSTVSVTVKYDPLESFSCGRVSTLIILETQNDWTNDQFPRRSTILQILKDCSYDCGHFFALFKTFGAETKTGFNIEI